MGYEGTTLSRITEKTGLGKGSLYHFFPGGKADMATEVLAEIDMWFEQSVFTLLRQQEPGQSLNVMWDAVDAYFQSGRRVCLVGAFALEETRDRFAIAIGRYFRRWVEAVRAALKRDGFKNAEATAKAEEIVAGIQGALVLARATNDSGAFTRTIIRLRQTYAKRLAQPAPRPHRGGRALL
jgi:TetR/AcrR family transcriptional regulator, lmrAB and yxaGH operons repressor